MRQDRGHLRARFAFGEPRQFASIYPAELAELGQQRTGRMTTVQLVRPEGHHDQHAVQEAVIADQECEQIPGGAVRPVHVLDDQDNWRHRGESLEQYEDLPEEPGSRLPLIWIFVVRGGLRGLGRLGDLSKLRYQPSELRS